jgi:hypothetical protein
MKRRKPYRDGKVHVNAAMCATCIFHPGNLMQLNGGRVKGMVDNARECEGVIVCHETLGGNQSVCRGFFDRYSTIPLRLARALNVIVYDESPDARAQP